MFNALAPSDFVVAVPFRWRGVVYDKGSGLPAGMPQGAIHQFLHKDPPLIELKNGSGKASKKKTSKKTTKKTTKKTAKKKASKKTTKRG